MNRLVMSVATSLICLSAAWAQSADTPASREDVERYLTAVHSRELMDQYAQAMAKQLQQMAHEQFVKAQDQLPVDFEQRMDGIINDMLKDLPSDEMVEGMIPVYQKHFTKNDLDALVKFYSGPTGQKILQVLPAVSAEAAQTAMPIMQRQMAIMSSRIQQDVAQSLHDRQKELVQKSLTRN